MDSDTIWHHIDAERLRLADVLGDLDEGQWLSPSLCAGWTVRDVAAHLAMEDDQYLHGSLYNEFEMKLARLQEGAYLECGVTEDAYG